MTHYLTILGMPGAGKDTQVEYIAASFPSLVIKTGDIARSLADANSDVKRVLARGGLISDELINSNVATQVAKATDNSLVVFDGFPRRLQQAEWLDILLGDVAQSLRVYYLEIARVSASSRLLSRKRADDKPDVIKHRLDVFAEETLPVLDYYRRSGRLVTIDGEQPPEVIADEIRAKVGVWI